jgi:Mg2+ and Co2+ transporter CorA
MKIHCYRIEENGSLTSLAGEDWQHHRAETQSPLWVHIEGGSASQVRGVLEPLALHDVLLGMIEDYYQTLLTNSRYLDPFTNRLDERVKDLNSQFTLYVQEKTNRKLAVLTVISAIFLPLTLIAGIYGMNYSDMPELGWKYGYPAVLLLMGAVAGGLMWVFKRRGWFD